MPVLGDGKENPVELKSKPIGVIIPPPDIRSNILIVKSFF